MSYGHFVDRTLAPDEELTEATVGAKYSEWKEICGYLALESKAKAEWKFLWKELRMGVAIHKKR
jgi:hypothetical protein